MKILGDRLSFVTCHDAIILLRHSMATPKLLYTFRIASCFLASNLKDYDDVLRFIISNITNNNLVKDDSVWLQASFPVKFGGLDIRRAVQLAPSATLLMLQPGFDLVSHILPTRLNFLHQLTLDKAIALWSRTAPSCASSHLSPEWDILTINSTAYNLLDSATDSISIACFLAGSSEEAGAWLNALPISSLGPRMDDNTCESAVGLRLGSALCRPHMPPLQGRSRQTCCSCTQL